MQVDLCARVGLALAAALQFFLGGSQPSRRQQSLQRQTYPEPALSGRQTELISASQTRNADTGSRALVALTIRVRQRPSNSCLRGGAGCEAGAAQVYQ